MNPTPDNNEEPSEDPLHSGSTSGSESPAEIEPAKSPEPAPVQDANPAAPTAKRENLWVNISLNVLIPSLLMTKGKTWLNIDNASLLLVIALAFPVAYGLYDFYTRKKFNFFSVLGFVSILITGGVGLFELDKDWIAWKEAAIPALFGIAVFVSLYTPFPLVRTFLYNPELFNIPKIDAALDERDNHRPFEKLMVTCTLYLVASFALSTVLNFVLAKYFIKSETGSDEFVKEVGRMTFWSYFFIVAPTMVVTMAALMKLLKGIKELTGYELEDVMLVGHPNDAAKSEKAEEQEEQVAEKS